VVEEFFLHHSRLTIRHSLCLPRRDLETDPGFFVWFCAMHQAISPITMKWIVRWTACLGLILPAFGGDAPLGGLVAKFNNPRLVQQSFQQSIELDMVLSNPTTKVIEFDHPAKIPWVIRLRDAKGRDYQFSEQILSDSELKKQTIAPGGSSVLHWVLVPRRGPGSFSCHSQIFASDHAQPPNLAELAKFSNEINWTYPVDVTARWMQSEAKDAAVLLQTATLTLPEKPKE